MGLLPNRRWEMVSPRDFLESYSIRIFSGCYGLSSKDTTPAQIAAVYENTDKIRFTVGITDDVTHHSLRVPSILVRSRTVMRRTVSGRAFTRWELLNGR